MNKVVWKVIALVLALVLSVGMLGGCGKQEPAELEALVDTAVKAALDSETALTSVTIEADGKFITLEDTAGMTVQQLLAQAKVTLNEGDIVSFDPNQVVGGDLTIKVLRVCSVTITVTAKDPAKNTTYHTTLVGGTIADALESVGLKLSKNQAANYELDDVLTDNMEIVISPVKAEEKKDATTEATKSTEATEATEPATEESSDEWSDDDWSDDDWSDDDWSDDDWSDDDWSDDDWSDDDWSDDDWSDDDWSDDDWSDDSGSDDDWSDDSGSDDDWSDDSGSDDDWSDDSGSDDSGSDDSGSGDSGRYVVSEDVYYDCDGSGHGVKVITYSDGTQEEVYF